MKFSEKRAHEKQNEGGNKMRSKSGVSKDDQQSGNTEQARGSWIFPDEFCTDEMDKRSPAQWVEFMIVGQRRKHSFLND